MSTGITSLEALRQRCQSPAEERFLEGFLGIPGAVQDTADYSQWEQDCLDYPNEVALKVRPYVSLTSRSHLALYGQIAVGPYRSDFALTYVMTGNDGEWWPYDHPFAQSGEGILLIDIDGHDWHEKTREQAARDKARDRFMVRHGYRVIRYSASEVVASPVNCAANALDIANRNFDRAAAFGKMLFELGKRATEKGAK